VQVELHVENEKEMHCSRKLQSIAAIRHIPVLLIVEQACGWVAFCFFLDIRARALVFRSFDLVVVGHMGGIFHFCFSSIAIESPKI
jgi:hypothetical protein